MCFYLYICLFVCLLDCFFDGLCVVHCMQLMVHSITAIEVETFDI